jgi:hypothetical protein
MPRCRYCGNDLRAAPAGITSCREWASYQARHFSDMLPTDLAGDLTIMPLLCGLEVVVRDSLDDLPREVTG